MKNFWQKLKKPILALAPMAGITDSPFRQICKSFGADLVYTEMVSADGLAYNSKKTLEFLKFDESERPVILQLFGRKPENFVKAINLINQLPSDKLLVTSDSPASNSSNRKLIASNIGAGLLRPDGIDINMGCPTRKVIGHGGGVSLMRDLGLCREIVKAVCDTSELPVSLKIRTSILNSNPPAGGQISNYGKITALDLLKHIEDLPIKAVMIHGRSYEQGFSGPIDAKMIREIVKKYGKKWTILANGGINSAEDAKRMLNLTRAPGIGLARGILGKPWLFEEIKEYLKNKKDGNTYSHLQDWEKIKRVALKHARLAYKSKGGHGIIEMRKHLAWYVKGRPDACKLRRRLVRVERLEEMKEILK